MKVNLVTSVLAVLGAVILAILYRPQFWPPMRIAGAVLGLVSLILLLTARYQLGRSFSIQAKARELVTTGLYARIRNPIYVFGVCLVVAAALFFMRWSPLAILIVVIPMQVVRMRREAAVLETAFGEQYREYRRQTWF
jgi:protein-S-isoprenylcysteine O-methyltransferase Ste14